ncbi:MAG TPA: hypothetical protein VNM67_21270 [Thermoanaerobaculia bacterium]|nr:hypothetical protein [Thermoanaerobaculia bacterium]
MGYGASPTKWTVKTITSKGNPRFDLKEGDVLEFTGNGDGTSVTRRHRVGSPSIDWGSVCAYDPKNSAVKGVHNASAGADEFLIIITPATSGTKATHTGHIDPKGPGTGGNGTWTAEEGG